VDGSRNLVVYSAMGPPGELVRAFEKKSGIHVTYVNMGGGPLQARLYAEGRRPHWTIAWFVGDAAMAALDHAGLVARHSPGDADWPAADWTPEARRLIPADGSFLPTGLTLAGVFVTRRTGPEPLRDWSALRTYSGGAIGLVSPVASGTAYPVLSAMMQASGGVARGHSLLRALRNHGLEVAASNPLLLGQLRSGDVALAILPSEAAYAAARRDPSVRITLPRPAGVMPAVIAVSSRAGPEARQAAARFVEFLLTPEGQRLIRSSTAEGIGWPATNEADVPQDLPPLASLSLIHPDANLWGGLEGVEVGWFRHRIAE
jgi:iron(III) transport system substrate-binding protein